MKKLTKLWTELDTCLSDVGNSPEFTSEMYEKFDEIFDIKDVIEYKAAVNTDTQSPSEFMHLSQAMRRALVEGYLLAQMEQRKDDIKSLWNCYRLDMENENEKTFDINKYPHLVRRSNSLCSRHNSDNA